MDDLKTKQLELAGEFSLVEERMSDIETKQHELFEKFSVTKQLKACKVLKSLDITDSFMLLNRMREIFEWDKWKKEIPYINFDTDWLVKAIPPEVNGIIRYWLKHKYISGSHVSVYLDCYDLLGFVGEPYWVVCPIEGDTERYLLHETHDLIGCIRRSFAEQAEAAQCDLES